MQLQAKLKKIRRLLGQPPMRLVDAMTTEALTPTSIQSLISLVGKRVVYEYETSFRDKIIKNYY